MRRCALGLAAILAMLDGGAASAQAVADAARPVTVSPGRVDRLLIAADRCPTFSWGRVDGAVAYELAVVRATAEAWEVDLAETAWRVALPGTAQSFTPDAGSCLAQGERYAWLVRARAAGGDTSTSNVPAGDASPAWSAWSEPAFFEIAGAPSVAEVEEALEVLRQHLESAGVEAPSLGVLGREGATRVVPPTLVDDRSDPGANAGGDAPVVRDETRGTAATYGLRVVASSEEGAAVLAENTAPGPDLVLGGAPAAGLSEAGLSRSSAAPLQFDFANTGGGGMTLRVDGVEVVTTATDQDTVYAAGNQLELGGGNTFGVVEGAGSGLDADTLDGLSSAEFLAAATDDWVDETGDTMNGPLTLDPASGLALQTGSGDDIDLGGDLLQAGTLFAHRRGTSNAAFGASALAATTTGFDNTAVGASALTLTTSGSGNTAVGARALDALGDHAGNIGNTAIGWEAMGSTTQSHRNVAVGARALFQNTVGYYNVAVGYRALSSTGATATFPQATRNVAVGSRALDGNTVGHRNTAVGNSALLFNTTGANNAAFGAFALASNLTGSYNTAVGLSALGSATAGSGLTAVGVAALFSNTSGAGNTAAGNRALAQNQSGSNNTALGAYALNSNTTASRNTAAGFESMLTNTTGYYNTAFGAGALRDATTATRNTALGNRALQQNTTGIRNTALGHRALYGNGTENLSTAVGAFALEGGAAQSTAVGAYALQDNTTGYSNTAIGMQALQNNTQGKNNTAVGRGALLNNIVGLANTAAGAFAMLANTEGEYNTAIGDLALQSNLTGDHNIALGFQAGSQLLLDNNIVIGNLGTSTDSARIRIGSTQTETFIAGISGNTAAGGIPVIVNGSGELGTTTSSRRFKEDIHDLGEASETIFALRPVSFRYTREAAGEGERPIEYGLIAEEVAEVLPDLVVLDAEGRPFTVRYHLLVPLLLRELQVAKRQIRELEARLGPVPFEAHDGRTDADPQPTSAGSHERRRPQ